MKINFKNILFLIGLFFSASIYPTDFDFLIKPVDLKGEISAEKINVIFADSSGFLWLGTNTGLFRWDGAAAMKYEKNDGSEKITAISQATDGKIWVGFKDGSLAYTYQRKLISFNPDNYHNDSTSVSDIIFNQNGNMWWSTYGSGVYCNQNNTTLSINENNGLTDNYVYEIAFGADDKVWAATDNGVNIFNVDCSTNSFVPSSFSAELPDLIVLTLVKDNDGFMWFGFHQGGIGYYNPNTGKFNKINNSKGQRFGKISSLSMEENDVWIVDEKNGICYSKHPHTDSLIEVRFADKEINKGIRAAVSDQQGNLWILTKKNLYVSNGGTIKVVDFKSGDHNKLHSINIDGEKGYWLTNNKNMIKLDQNGFHYYLEDALDFSTTLTSSIIDPSGKIWAGTLGQGIVVLDPKDGSYRFISSKQGLINDNILSMGISNNTVWVATLGGTSAIELDNKSKIVGVNSYNKDNGLTSNFIYTVFVDSKDRVWFGTDGSGIIKFENNIFYTFDDMQEIGDKIIYSIIEDQKGSVWFSTSTGMLYKIDNLGFEKYSKGMGFSGNNIYSLAANGDFLYILTEEGLNVFNCTTKNFVCLNEELGIDQFESDLNSVAKSEKIICFATHQNIIQIDIELIQRLSIRPSILIDRITVNLEPLDFENPKPFSHNENRFIFEYSSNWPLAPDKLQYQVKLEGYDPEWKTTFDRSAVYPNLPPGRYAFKVKSFLNNLSTDDSGSTFEFTIRKPYYLSLWFIVLISCILIAAVYWYIKVREKRLKKVENFKKEQLEFEFQTLKNQINPHFLFNSFSTLISIIEENPEEAVEYTEALSGFFRDILEVKDQQLIPLSEELRMMKNYSLIHQKRLGENFKVDIQLDDEIKSSKIPPLTLQLLTENALKHNVIGKGKPLSVSIWNDADSIFVENNIRLKKQTEQSTGIGLRNIIERYKLITRRNISVESTAGLFKVMLPIIK